MRTRFLASLGAVALGLAGLSLTSGTLAGQTKAKTPAAKSYAPPRTSDGQPDLQGVWANNNATPLERPKELAGRAYLKEQELEALKKKSHELFDNGNSDAAFGDTVFVSALANVKGEKQGFTSTD